MNIQDWFPLGWIGWLFLQSKGFSRAFCNTTVEKHQFFSSQLSLWSNSHIHMWLLIHIYTHTHTINWSLLHFAYPFLCQWIVKVFPHFGYLEWCCVNTGFPGGSVGKEPARSTGDLGSIPGSGRSSGEGNGNPLQSPHLENTMDRGACSLQSMGLQELDTTEWLNHRINSGVQVFVWVYACSSLVYVPRSEIAGSYGNLCVASWGIAKVFCWSCSWYLWTWWQGRDGDEVWH